MDLNGKIMCIYSINIVSEVFSSPFWYHLAFFPLDFPISISVVHASTQTHTHTEQHVSAPLTQTHSSFLLHRFALLLSLLSLSPSLYPIVSWLWTAFPPCVNRRLVCVAGRQQPRLDRVSSPLFIQPAIAELMCTFRSGFRTRTPPYPPAQTPPIPDVNGPMAARGRRIRQTSCINNSQICFPELTRTKVVHLHSPT